MQCPSCSVHIHQNWRPYPLGAWGRLSWEVLAMNCPNCAEAIIALEAKNNHGVQVGQRILAFPKRALVRTAPAETPPHIAEDYNEAALVLTDSPKASAALSRRCVQAVLRDAGYAQRDLAPAIQAALDDGKLPRAIAENLDAIRNIGNFAAHPLKATNTGEILPVEPEEAEWNLEVLESLFEHYYVQPARAAERRAKLDEKLAKAGKPPMKVPE